MMVTPVRMQESGEQHRKMENTTSKEDDILDKLIETTDTKPAGKEEDLDFVSCKVSGLEGEPPSEKNSPTFMT